MKLEHIYYKVSKNYWIEIDSKQFSIIDFVKLENDSLVNDINKKLSKGAVLNKLFCKNLGNRSNYYSISNGKTLFIYRIRTVFLFNEKEYKDHFALISNSFRLKRKEDLLNKVFANRSCTIEEVLKEVTKYIFCENFSLWLFNDITDYFTHITSSYTPSRFFRVKNPDAKHIEKFKTNNDYICEDFINRDSTIQELRQTKTVNHIKIDLNLTQPEKSNFLIVNFFSVHENYELISETIDLIAEIIRLKFTKDYYPKALQNNDVASRLNESNKLGSFQSYLDGSIEIIIDQYNWEASSIFIIDNDKYLELRSLKEHTKRDLIGIKPYNIDDNSLTSKTFKENKIHFSYDVANNNSHTKKFEEKTKHEKVNWIFIPIATHNIEPVGIIRVKNKLDVRKKQVISFDKIDIQNLIFLAENIAIQYKTEKQFEEEHLRNVEKIAIQREENKELREFMRTYRHEIKTPLSLLTTASNRIKSQLMEEGFISNVYFPKKLNEILLDLDAVSKRLTYVVNSLSFDANDLIKEIKKVNLFKEVIIPIHSFSKQYAIKKKKKLNINKDSFLFAPVKCDIFSAQMAFHVLIDNAIKYSKNEDSIYVFGKCDSGFAKVIVENHSIIALNESEKDKLFNKFYRSKEAEERRFEGSGIGLYLAKGIMDKIEGKILLTSLNNPTRFELHFKLY
jgi:signal transduction histidine kinase